MSKELTIVKSQIEIYKIRKENSSLWADISLDYNGNAGRINISSDYGDWQYYWGACGEPFKDFLISLNIHYAANKFGADKYFDHEKTMARLKSRIEEYTDDEGEKEVLLQEIGELEDCSEKESFVHIMHSCSKILEMEDNCPDLTFSIHPLFNRFWDEMYKPFTDHLKKEAE